MELTEQDKLRGVCEHGLLRRSCEICELKEEVARLQKENARYRKGLNDICQMDEVRNITVLDKWGMVALAKYVLDDTNKYE